MEIISLIIVECVFNIKIPTFYSCLTFDTLNCCSPKNKIININQLIDFFPLLFPFLAVFIGKKHFNFEYSEIFAKKNRFISDQHLSKGKKSNISLPPRCMMYVLRLIHLHFDRNTINASFFCVLFHHHSHSCFSFTGLNRHRYSI